MPKSRDDNPLFFFQFQEILKPNYNSVDFSEVELVFDPKHDEPRYNYSNLFAVRCGLTMKDRRE